MAIRPWSQGAGATNFGSQIDSENNEVFGYYPDVKGDGTLFDGPGYDRKLYKNILEGFSNIGTPVSVKNLKISKYRELNDKASIESKIEQLNNLLSKGLINEVEYNNKKHQLLEEF